MTSIASATARDLAEEDWVSSQGDREEMTRDEFFESMFEVRRGSEGRGGGATDRSQSLGPHSSTLARRS